MKKTIYTFVVFQFILSITTILVPSIADFTGLINVTEISACDGKGWIEIKNDSSEKIDISNWRMKNGNSSSHKLSGNTILESGEYAVIVDNYNDLTSRYPTFDGKIIDSSFDLANNGEVIQLLSGSEIMFVGIAYPECKTAKSWIYIDTKWQESDPSPGLKNDTGLINVETGSQITDVNTIISTNDEVYFSPKLEIVEINSCDGVFGEYIEIVNKGDTIDLTKLKIFENYEKVPLLISTKNTLLHNMEYLIIADNPSLISGSNLMQVNFSLSNSGEKIGLIYSGVYLQTLDFPACDSSKVESIYMDDSGWYKDYPSPFLVNPTRRVDQPTSAYNHIANTEIRIPKDRQINIYPNIQITEIGLKNNKSSCDGFDKEEVFYTTGKTSILLEKKYKCIGDDWIEITCFDCDTQYDISNLTINTNHEVFRFQNINIKNKEPLVVVLPEKLSNNEGLIYLSNNGIVDAFCWQDGSEFSHSKEKLLEEIYYNGHWDYNYKESCFDVRDIKNDQILLRKNIFYDTEINNTFNIQPTSSYDTNKREDWVVSNIVSPASLNKPSQKCENIKLEISPSENLVNILGDKDYFGCFLKFDNKKKYLLDDIVHSGQILCNVDSELIGVNKNTSTCKLSIDDEIKINNKDGKIEIWSWSGVVNTIEWKNLKPYYKWNGSEWNSPKHPLIKIIYTHSDIDLFYLYITNIADNMLKYVRLNNKKIVYYPYQKNIYIAEKKDSNTGYVITFFEDILQTINPTNEKNIDIKNCIDTIECKKNFDQEKSQYLAEESFSLGFENNNILLDGPQKNINYWNHTYKNNDDSLELNNIITDFNEDNYLNFCFKKLDRFRNKDCYKMLAEKKEERQKLDLYSKANISTDMSIYKDSNVNYSAKIMQNDLVKNEIFEQKLVWQKDAEIPKIDIYTNKNETKYISLKINNKSSKKYILSIPTIQFAREINFGDEKKIKIKIDKPMDIGKHLIYIDGMAVKFVDIKEDYLIKDYFYYQPLQIVEAANSWVKVYNPNYKDINIDNWSINSSKKILNTVIKSRNYGFLSVKIGEIKTIKLQDPDGEIVSQYTRRDSKSIKENIKKEIIKKEIIKKNNDEYLNGIVLANQQYLGSGSIFVLRDNTNGIMVNINKKQKLINICSRVTIVGKKKKLKSGEEKFYQKSNTNIEISKNLNNNCYTHISAEIKKKNNKNSYIIDNNKKLKVIGQTKEKPEIDDTIISSSGVTIKDYIYILAKDMQIKYKETDIVKETLVREKKAKYFWYIWIENIIRQIKSKIISLQS